MVIWKYNLPLQFQKTIPMPQGAKPLHLGHQYNESERNLWVLVDPDEPVVDMKIYWLPTGAKVESGMEYIGTLVESDNTVWHCFWRRADE